MTKFPACLLAALILGCAAFDAVRAQNPPATEGAKPYTPSRLEWLAVKLNAELGRQFSQGGFQMLFVPAETENTILIIVNYFKGTVPEGQIETEVKHAKKVIQLTAKARKWDSWLEVKEIVKATQ